MMEKSRNVIIDDSFPSIPGNQNQIIDIIINRIKEFSVSIMIDYDELYLIIDEALSNAMEHGNHWDPHKLVDVKIIQTNDYISITIEDEGSGFNIREYSETEVPNLACRGRGIQIIKHFCKPLWNDHGNMINFCIDIK